MTKDNLDKDAKESQGTSETENEMDQRDTNQLTILQRRKQAKLPQKYNEYAYLNKGLKKEYLVL